MPQLPEMVRALLEPKAYPDRLQGIELVQTQMSFVFLTDNYVYKVKKPVNLGYLDYTTLDKRHFYCQKEVKLNRRLCPDAYLGVVPITQLKGDIFMEGQGGVMEYAVKMRRLPQKAMMDVLLTNNQLSPEMVSSVAQKLVEFHKKAETNASISAFGNFDNITVNTEENFTQTEKYIGNTISLKDYQHLKDYTDRFIERNVSLFGKRMAQGRIRDCHGDPITQLHKCLYR